MELLISEKTRYTMPSGVCKVKVSADNEVAVSIVDREDLHPCFTIDDLDCSLPFIINGLILVDGKMRRSNSYLEQCRKNGAEMDITPLNPDTTITIVEL